METRERIAYVRGLLEGAEGSGAEAKNNIIWQNILDVCDSLAESIAELKNGHEELEEYVCGIDADLCELEDAIWGPVDDEAEPARMNGSSHEPHANGGQESLNGAADDAGDDEHVRADCPRCGEEVFFEESFLYDDDVEISCPECGEVLYRSNDIIVDEEGTNELL